MLISFTETNLENEEELKSWFVNEHIDERALNTDGFFRARFYECVDNGPKFFATYETKNFEVLKSKNYLDKVSNQTEWSKKIIPKLSLLDRMTGNVTLDKMHGYSGKIMIYRFLPKENLELKQELRKKLKVVFDNLVKLDWVNGVCLVENESSLSNSTGEKAQNIGGKPNLEIKDEWIIILEGYETNKLIKTINNIYYDEVKDEYIDKKISKSCYELIYGNHR